MKMRASESQMELASARASKSGSLWLIVIGFFAFGAVASVILSSFLPSEKLAGEIAFFVALLVLYLVVRPFAEVNTTHVTDLIAGSGLYLTQLLLSLVMKRSLAIGLSVVLFVIVRELVLLPYRNRGEDNRILQPNQALAAILLPSLLLGALAFVISELLMRLWTVWLSR
jgi:hypothetical protein